MHKTDQFISELTILGNFEIEKFQQAIVFYQDVTMSGNNSIDLGSF